jgi:hypothetical protein
MPGHPEWCRFPPVLASQGAESPFRQTRGKHDRPKLHASLGVVQALSEVSTLS